MENNLPEKDTLLQEAGPKMREALAGYFELSEELRPQSLLFEELVSTYGLMLNKIEVYLSFYVAWGSPEEDPAGNLGYRKRLIGL